MDQACELFSSRSGADAGAAPRERFLSAFGRHKRGHGGSYIEVVQGLPADISREGTVWLETIIRELCAQVGALFPSLDLLTK